MTGEVLQTLCFRITKHCNLSCTHCRAGSSPLTNTPGDTVAFLQFVQDVLPLGLRHVSVSGGEPGVDARLGATVAHLLDLGLCVTVTTNGTVPVVEALVRAGVTPSRRLRIRVSLDGARRVHDAIRGDGTFVKAVESVRVCREWLGWVGVNTVVTPEVLDSIEELVDGADECGVEEWALITPVAEGTANAWVLDDDEVLARALEAQIRMQHAGATGRVLVWNFLGTPNTSLLITPEGHIVFAGVSEGGHQIVGSLHDYDIAQLEVRIREQVEREATNHFKWYQWPE